MRGRVTPGPYSKGIGHGSPLIPPVSAPLRGPRQIPAATRAEATAWRGDSGAPGAGRLPTVLRQASYVQPPAHAYVYAPPSGPLAAALPAAAPVEERAVAELVRKEVQKVAAPGALVTSFSRAEYAQIADQVVALLARRLTVEKERISVRG